jgi:hypothetical protein
LYFQKYSSKGDNMPRVKLGNGELRDQIREDLFDTHIQSPAQSMSGITKFFSQTQGKAEHLTNLRQNNILENQVSYLVQGIGFDAQTYDIADHGLLQLVTDHSAFKLRIGEKVYWNGALRFITGKIASDLGGSLISMVQQFGSHDSSKYALKGIDSIAIPPLQTFSCELNVAGFTPAEDAAAQPNANDVYYVCSLKGLLRRPVQ